MRTRALSTASAAVLWLLVILLGISLGAGLYESRVVVPLWQSTPPDRWVASGTAFWMYVTTGPLTLTILAGAWLARHAPQPIRFWWLLALGIAFLERLSTFGYFIPTLIDLQARDSWSDAESAALARWALLDYGRHLLTAGAWLAALVALRASARAGRS